MMSWSRLESFFFAACSCQPLNRGRLLCCRPETWDHAALSDARDAIRHVRSKVGHGVPIMGAGFSFGGCLLTAIVGSVPQEEHGLCGLVSGKRQRSSIGEKGKMVALM